MTRHTPHATRHTRIIAGIVAACLFSSLGSAANQTPTPRFLVEHEPVGFTGDHASLITAAINAAKAVNGIVEFEAGKVYRTSQVKVWRDTGPDDDNRRMIAGIEGNGAVLKWPTGVDPSTAQSMIYLWAPEFKGNSGFFIRNLTLDCGNNDIPTFATREDEGAGLAGFGENGNLAFGDKACDYGLRIFGGEDFLIENVTSLRAKKFGVYVETSNTYAVRNVVFRQVMSRFCEETAWQFANPTGSSNQISNITLENCYGHRSQKHGFYFERADNIRLISCGAEKNKNENVYVDSTVTTFDWLGGYTEKGNYNSLDPPMGLFVDKGMKFEDGAGPVRILGGRLLGRFYYDDDVDQDFLVHSYGHTKTGFNGSNVPDNNTISPIADNYKPTSETTFLRDKVATAYHEIPDYMRFRKGMDVFGTTCSTKQDWQTALADKLNIFVVLHSWDPSKLPSPGAPVDLDDQTSNITGRITAAKNASGLYSGVLAFEPGVVYQTKPILIQGQFGASGAGVIGVLGCGATLLAIADDTGVLPLLKVDLTHGSQDPENDHYGFWLSHLTLGVNQLYPYGLEVTRSKYFHLLNVGVSGAADAGVRCNAPSAGDVYYGVFDRVFSHDQGDAVDKGNGFEIRADTVNISDVAIGIANANVGFYRCRSQYNDRAGVAVNYASVMFVDCIFSTNRLYEAEMTQTRSVDFINCDLREGFDDTVGLRINDTGSTYYGVHLLGGRLRNRLNLATSAGAGTVTYGTGVSHSMVHTDYDPNLPTAQSASFLYNVAGDGSMTNVAEGNGI